MQTSERSIHSLVDNVKPLSVGTDIALLHVEDGINSDFFNFPVQRVEEGRILSLIGYGTEGEVLTALIGFGTTTIARSAVLLR